MLNFTQEKTWIEAVSFYIFCLMSSGFIMWLSHFSLFGFIGERDDYLGITISVLLSVGLLLLIYTKKMSSTPLAGIFLLTVIFSAFSGIVTGFIFPAMLTTKKNRQLNSFEGSEQSTHDEIIFSQLFCFAMMLMTISPAIMSLMLLDVEPNILKIVFMLSLLALPISFLMASVVGFCVLKFNLSKGEIIAKKLLYIPFVNVLLIGLLMIVAAVSK